MGTDIHMACEVRRNGKWELVRDKVFKNHWYDPDSNYSWAQEQYTYIPYDDRCYNLFAIRELDETRAERESVLTMIPTDNLMRIMPP